MPYFVSNLSGGQKDKVGTEVNIKGYTGDARYICPEDGYVELNSGATSSGYASLNLFGSNDVYACSVTLYILRTFQRSSMYVKKGMKLQMGDGATITSLTAVYRPIIS